MLTYASHVYMTPFHYSRRCTGNLKIQYNEPPKLMLLNAIHCVGIAMLPLLVNNTYDAYVVCVNTHWVYIFIGKVFSLYTARP